MKPKIKTTCTKLQLQLLSFCLLCLSGKTRCDGNGPAFVTVEQDSDAVLPCSLSPKENIGFHLFDWKKPAQIDGGQKKVFYYDAGIHYNNGYPGQSEEFKGRVSHFPEELKHGNASIIIRNTMVADSGDYTCDFPDLQPRQTFHIKLVVEPVVVAVEEDGHALLPCSHSTEENTEQGYFTWDKVAQNNEKPKEVFLYDKGKHSNNGSVSQDEGFEGRVSHFQEELKHGNASIIIRNTKMADSGNYTCTFTEPRKTFHIKLVVGAAKKPSITALEQTKDWSRLQCEVQGASPKPKVEWKDSSGNILPAEEPQVTDRGGSYDIILQTTVTKTDYYHCVVTQEEIKHQTEAKIHVYISGAAPKPNIRTLDQTDNRALLQCEANGHPQPEVEWRDSAGNKLPPEEPQVSERDGRFYVTLNTTVTKTDHYRCVATQKDISHQIYDETFVRLNDGVLKDRTDENIRGAAPKPVVMTHKTKNGVLLQCEVQGSPQPTVEWKDSAGSTLPAGETQVSERDGRSYFTVNTTVTRSDDFRCVATQKEINHTIYTKIYVPPSVPDPPTGWIFAGVLCTVIVGGGAAFAIWRHKKKTPNKGSPADPKEGSAVPLNGQPSQSQEAPDPET